MLKPRSQHSRELTPSPNFTRQHIGMRALNQREHVRMITQMLLGAAPFIWEMVQPMIVGVIMKKVKSLFGGGDKKKKKIKKVKKKASDLD